MFENFEKLKEAFYLIKKEQTLFYKNPAYYLKYLISCLSDENLKEKILNVLNSNYSAKDLDNILSEISVYIANEQFDLNKSDLSEISIDKIKGVGTKAKTYFQNCNVFTIEDLLYFFPFRYEVIGNNNSSKKSILSGIFVKGEIVFTRNGKRIYKAYFQSATGFFSAVWFRFSNQYPAGILKEGKEYNLFGEVSVFSGVSTITHPEFLNKEDLNIIRPVYPSVGNLKQKTIQNIIKNALESFGKHIADYLPFEILKKYNFPSTRQAVLSLHLPETENDVNKIYDRSHGAVKRLAYEELFYLQLGLALKKQQYEKIQGPVISEIKEYLNKIKDFMPFMLTKSQKKVLTEILNDISSNIQMNRLLQGDVGSGKTIIAFITTVIMCENGYQTAIIAPTEVLAEQHFNKFIQFAGSHYCCELLVGSTKQKDKRDIYERCKEGEINVIVGTHAIIQEKIEFKNLGLAIIDEQHRFGVMQRKALIEKGLNPHILLMTATPIPRTLAISYYGDLDISIIDELPKGRLPVKTSACSINDTEKIVRLISEQIKSDRNVYVVYPLVEESEFLDAENVTKGFEYFRQIFGDKVAMLHGKMKAEEKNNILEDFKKKKYQILISTTVIEVGIDVPDATLMIIMNAERFGLSQLHQLRGRVGRNDIQSYCVLAASENISDEGKERINAMIQYTDGFKLSETDLKMRGPGDFFGVRQSGMPELKYANLFEDAELLNKARKDAFRIIKNDPLLEHSKNRVIKQGIVKKWKKTLDMIRIG